MEYFLLFCVISLCAWNSWKLGITEGCERTLKKLKQEKIISIKPNGDISPNQFWVENKTDV